MVLSKISYVEFYVFNAFQTAGFYSRTFGFDIIGYGDSTTGLNGKISYILKSKNIKLVMTSSSDPGSSILQHVLAHDDGVKDVVFVTKDVKFLFQKSIEYGAIPILEPTELNDGTQKIIKASIRAFGGTTHSFVEEYLSNDCLPFYKPVDMSNTCHKTYLEDIDHMAIAVPEGTLYEWQEFYKTIFGFHVFSSENIYLGKSGMNSVVLANEAENIKFVFVEPVSGEDKSQLENYIRYNNQCAGVQHLAFLSKNIIHDVALFKSNGINFLDVPDSYYCASKQDFFDDLDIKLSRLKELNILVDSEGHDSYIMQIFTKPLQNRPTFFIEIIQRERASGFGSGNIKALYNAVQDLHTKIG
jgi:4-hydroxyphenylpyruvate dioxygenase